MLKSVLGHYLEECMDAESEGKDKSEGKIKQGTDMELGGVNISREPN